MFETSVNKAYETDSSIIYTDVKTKEFLQCVKDSMGIWFCYDKTKSIVCIFAPRIIVELLPGKLLNLMKMHKVPLIAFVDLKPLEAFAIAYFVGFAKGKERVHDKIKSVLGITE
jgi:hypothetical protein